MTSRQKAKLEPLWSLIAMQEQEGNNRIEAGVVQDTQQGLCASEEHLGQDQTTNVQRGFTCSRGSEAK